MTVEDKELDQDLTAWFSKLELKTKLAVGEAALAAHGVTPPGKVKFKKKPDARLVEFIDGKEVPTRVAPIDIVFEWLMRRALDDINNKKKKSVTFRIDVAE